MSTYQPKTAFGRFVDTFEQTAIAAILGVMTLLAFANVIVRYGFNSNLLWQLEATLFLFAWLVLFGMSHCFKTAAHLGVDILVNGAQPGLRRALGGVSVLVCLAFALLMLKGSWDYWLFAVGSAAQKAQDIPMPGALQFLADIANDGRPYDKLPKFIPYLILPLGMALLTFRILEAGWRIYLGEADRVIASYEAEEAIETASDGERT